MASIIAYVLPFQVLELLRPNHQNHRRFKALRRLSQFLLLGCVEHPLEILNAVDGVTFVVGGGGGGIESGSGESLPFLLPVLLSSSSRRIR